MPATLSDEMLRPRDLAELLHVSYHHVMRSYRDWDLPFLMVSGRVLWARKDVDEFLDRLKQAA
jgi:hypothetical protein